jgi:predicted nucleic acid-binding protein
VFLLDTNVVSELRKAPSGQANPGVVAWFRRLAPHQLYVSVITIVELEVGILQLERRDASQGNRLRHWLTAQVLPAFEGRILPVDMAVGSRCAQLMVPDPQSPWDALIAATALDHNLTIITRNVRDFQATGVALHNPWS